jgi:hypothetical protein
LQLPEQYGILHLHERSDVIAATHHKSTRLLFYFMLAWILVNLPQAAQMDVDADEAYYWFYSRQLAWGYFDHPPLVALSIKLGELFGHGPFYTRLGTVLLSGATVYFCFKALPGYLAHVPTYLAVFASAVLLHAYAFIATPDASLLFFASLYFYAYKRYLQHHTAPFILLLAFAITGLFYSKYHGILLVFFTVLSNPRLLLKPSAWLVTGLVVVAYIPHLWWQYQHGWPTFRYHLVERGAGKYSFSKTTDYLAGQLFIWGPLTTIPVLVLLFRQRRSYDLYERVHMFTVCGVFLVFLLSSFRSNVEPHWTLVAAPSVIVLILKVIYTASEKWQRRLRTLFLLNILLIVGLRVLFLVPNGLVSRVRAFGALVHARTWATEMHALAGDQIVVFSDSYRLPALYQYYYPDARTWGYNTLDYRKSQYNIGNDAFLNNQPVIITAPRQLSDTAQIFKSPYTTIYWQRMARFKVVNDVRISWMNPVGQLKNGETIMVKLRLHNQGKDTVQTAGLQLQYTFYRSRYEQNPTLWNIRLSEDLPPGATRSLSLQVVVPDAVSGTTRLVFSIVQPPLGGTFASPLYGIKVH